MEKVIEQVNWIKDLGVIVEDRASFNCQIGKVCKKYDRSEVGYCKLSTPETYLS